MPATIRSEIEKCPRCGSSLVQNYFNLAESWCSQKGCGWVSEAMTRSESPEKSKIAAVPTCPVCGSDSLGIEASREQRVYCHDCGHCPAEILAGHVRLAAVRKSLNVACNAWEQLNQIARMLLVENWRIEDADDVKRSAYVYLAQTEADISRFRDALKACKVARRALADLNGEVSREVWERLYPVTQQLDAVLSQDGPKES